MSYAGLGANVIGCNPPTCMEAVTIDTTYPPIDYPAATVQRALIAAGFPVGGTGADGVFGTNSESAMHQALLLLMVPEPAFLVSPDRHAVKLNPNVFTAITKIIPRVPTPAPPASHPAAHVVAPIVATPDMPADTGGGGMDWTPWLIGGGVLLAGAGAYFMFGKKKPGAAGASGKRTTHTVKNSRARRRSRRNSRRRHTRRGRRTSRNWAPTGRSEGYFVVGSHGQVVPGSGTLAGAMRDLKRLGGQAKGYRIEAFHGGQRRALGK